MAKQRATVAMTDDEVQAFLDEERTVIMSTLGPDGFIHSIAMWYGLVDGRVVMSTKKKSQKVLNLRRDPRITLLVEAGTAYDELRGVQIQGRAQIVEDDDERFRLSAGMGSRYRPAGAAVAEVSPEEERARFLASSYNRVAIVVEPETVASWDHRKLR